MMRQKTKQIRIEPTTEQMAAGQAYCLTCPISLSVNEHLSPGHHATTNISSLIGLAFIIIKKTESNRESMVVEYTLTERETQFIRDFDAGLNPEPIAFDIDLPLFCLKEEYSQ